MHKLLKKLGDILCDLDIATNRIDMTSPNEANEEADVPNELVNDGTGSDASNPRRSTDRYNARLKCYWEMYGSFLTIEVEKENYILLCELQDEKNDTASNAF